MIDENYKAFSVTFCEALHQMLDEAHTQKGDSNEMDSFDAGYLCCFHRVITLIQQQAELFDIPLSELSMSNIKDIDLIK